MDHGPRFVGIVDDAKSRITEVTIDELLQLRERGVPHRLIDVREESEWAAGALPDAEHMGKGVIERDIEAAVPELDTLLICYCGGGYRSAMVADNLQKMGYTNVRSLALGFRGWNARGLPVTATT